MHASLVKKRRMTNRSILLRAAVMSVAYATTTPVPRAFVRSGQPLRPCSPLIPVIYGLVKIHVKRNAE
jgi:hypothetical protein